jgi:hypothetical protein
MKTKLNYLDPARIQAFREDVDPPRYGRNVDGYGRKIPTGRWLKVRNRWRRVYVTQYSNAGTAWVVIDGARWIVS